VREAFVSYNRNNGRPRGFGFVVFESMDVADKVVSTKHTIDRREVRGWAPTCFPHPLNSINTTSSTALNII